MSRKRERPKPATYFHEDLMKRSIENRLQKLEQTDGKVVLIAFGPDETAEEASERYFQRNPQHRTATRILLIDTGVPRSRGTQYQ